MRKSIGIMLIAPCLFAAGVRASPASEEEPRLEELEARIAELEAQNRAILELLRELKLGAVDGRAAAAAGAASGRVVHTAAPAAAAPAAAGGGGGGLPEEIAVGGSRLGFYGFVRVDAIFDDSRPSHPQFPTFVESEDPALGPPGDGQLNFHPRLTRFGMNYRGPEIGRLGNARVSGKIEIDFQNGGRESRQIIRMRHGWLKIAWENWSLLAGQAWDAFSPLYPTVNGDSLMWNAGNLGDRRPQIRLAYEPEAGPFTFVGGIGLTGAIDSQDLDGDGVRDGDDSSLPHLQARFGFRGPQWAFGLWGHAGREETTVPIAGETEFDSHSLGVDFRFAVGDRATVQGELWRGTNLSDVRGGIGQGIHRATGREIDSEGGWLELGVELSDAYSVYGGATLDDPDDGDVGGGGRTENRTWYLAQRFRLGRPFLIGVEYLRWTTEFQGLADGTDNRFNLYLIYDF